MNSCKTCKFLYADERSSAYSRPKMHFCRKKGSFFSRNFKIGEGTRVDLNSPACKEYEKKQD